MEIFTLLILSASLIFLVVCVRAPQTFSFISDMDDTPTYAKVCGVIGSLLMLIFFAVHIINIFLLM